MVVRRGAQARRVRGGLPGMIAASALLSAAVLFTLPTGAVAQEKKVKDQKEYDLFTAATKEQDATKKAQYLDQWKKEYSDSDYKLERQTMIATNYFQGLRNGEEAWKASEELLTLDPKSFPAQFFITSLVISMNTQDPGRLDTGEKVARSLRENIPTVFDPAKKPATVSEDQWKNERLTYESLATKTIGWIQMQRKEFAKSEETFTEFLKANQNSGWVSYWLSTSMLQQKIKEKQIPALYHLARAAYYEGADALPPDVKKQLQAYLQKTYVSYHGGNDGLKDVIAMALKEPFPTTEFKIESKEEVIARQMEELRQNDPQKYLWLGLKKGLSDGATGLTYFENTLKGSALPKLKGKVVAATPEARPKEATIAILGEDAEIKLVFDTAHPAKIEPGTELEFEGGVAKEFVADPFLLTLEQEREKITGLPDPPKRAPARKAPVRRKKK
ncbi:MAG: hypothetical protein R2729_12545 [Bryobacteraceae bacterium]